MGEPVAGSVGEEDRLLVPIRMVEAVVYCPRQAWYRFVLNDDPLNVHMERGLRRHATLDEAEPPASDGVTYRHLPVAAPVLGVQGVVDEVTIGPSGTAIVEYKAARLPHYVWDGVVAQVAVQALALREHAAGERWLGPPLTEPVRLRVYFSDSRRYREIDWTSDTERLARDLVRRARAILEASLPPPGNVGPRCRNCQHEPICLPADLPAWLAAGAGRPAAVHEGEER